jgi:hypothetical protein
MFRVFRISAGQPVSRAIHRLVNPDRKEDGGALLTFLCQGGFHLLLDPLAGDRELGEVEQQLVVKRDCLINTRAEAVADFHILGSKPAPHPVVLEIRVEAFGKRVVLTRISDHRLDVDFGRRRPPRAAWSWFLVPS